MVWTCADITVRLPTNPQGWLRAANFSQLMSHLDNLHVVPLPLSLTDDPSIPTHFQRASVQDAWRCLSEMANPHGTLSVHFSPRLRDQLNTLREVQAFYQGAPVDLHTLASDLNDIRGMRSIRGTNDDIRHNFESFNTSLVMIENILHLEKAPPALVVEPPAAPVMNTQVQPTPLPSTDADAGTNTGHDAGADTGRTGSIDDGFRLPVRGNGRIVIREVIHEPEVHHVPNQSEHDIGFVAVLLGALAVYRLSSQKYRLRQDAIQALAVEIVINREHTDHAARIIGERDQAIREREEALNRLKTFESLYDEHLQRMESSRAALEIETARRSNENTALLNQRVLCKVKADALDTRLQGLDGALHMLLQSTGGQCNEIKEDLERILRQLNQTKQILLLLMDIQRAYGDIDEFIGKEGLRVTGYISFDDLMETPFPFGDRIKKIDWGSRLTTSVDLMEAAKLKIAEINADLPEDEKLSLPQNRLELELLTKRCLAIIETIDLRSPLVRAKASSDSLRQVGNLLAKERAPSPDDAVERVSNDILEEVPGPPPPPLERGGTS